MRMQVLGIAAVVTLLAPRAFVPAQQIEQAQDSSIRLVGCDSDCCDSRDSACQNNYCCDCSTCCCCCGPSLYASVNLRSLFDHLQSGGYNTVGDFPNTGSDDSETFSIGGSLGLAIPRDRGTLRVECEGIYVDPFNSVTNSFEPPTPTFFYQTRYSDRWAVLGNCWFDVPVNDCWDVYAGAGVGGGGATMSVDDSVVQGSGSSADVVWQVGCGVVRHYDRITFDLGYRYMDWGTSEVSLFYLGEAAGNYTAHVTSHQLFLGLRYNSLFDVLRR